MYIRVVLQDKLSEVDRVRINECPDRNQPAEHSTRRELFYQASEYLCNTVPGEYIYWSKPLFAQLVGTACDLTKKAFNCHCHGYLPHKGIYRDLLSVGTNKANASSRLEECETQYVEDIQQKEENLSSVFSKFHRQA